MSVYSQKRRRIHFVDRMAAEPEPTTAEFVALLRELERNQAHTTILSDSWKKLSRSWQTIKYLVNKMVTARTQCQVKWTLIQHVPNLPCHLFPHEQRHHMDASNRPLKRCKNSWEKTRTMRILGKIYPTKITRIWEWDIQEAETEDILTMISEESWVKKICLHLTDPDPYMRKCG